jgi:alcohol dehydrogenase class IV
MTGFEFATAGRIVFGAGKLREIGAIAKPFGRRALVVIGKSAKAVERVEPLLALLTDAGIEYATFSVSGEPTFDVIRSGTQHARGERCDLVISFGGGSVIDTGKAVAALLANGGDPLDYVEIIGKGRPLTQPSAPFLAIPTTAGTGSEATRNAVLGSKSSSQGAPGHRVKVSMRSAEMLPRVALVDPELTYDLPPRITATSGLDALTQLIEPFVSCRANPMIDAICRDGMQRVARSLPRAFEHGDDPAAREDMALAALFSGMALANAGLGAAHGFAGPIGGMFDAPHGALCAALLTPVMEINEKAVARSRQSATLQRFEEVRRIVGDVGELVRALGIPPLREYGVNREDFSAIIEQAKATSSMKGNPLPLRDEELREILERAL